MPSALGGIMFSSCGSRFQIRSRGRTDLNPVKPPPKQPGVLAVFTTSSVGGGEEGLSGLTQRWRAFVFGFGAFVPIAFI